MESTQYLKTIDCWAFMSHMVIGSYVGNILYWFGSGGQGHRGLSITGTVHLRASIFQIVIGLYEDKTINNLWYNRLKIKVVGVTYAKIGFDSIDKCIQGGDMRFFLKSIFLFNCLL